MGSSCLTYKGKHKFINDFEIEVVALSIVHLVEKTYGKKPIPKFAQVWKKQFPNFVNGAIDLHLDDFFPTVLEGSRFLELLEKARVDFVGERQFVTEERFKEYLSQDISLNQGGMPSEKINIYFYKIASFISEVLS